MKKRVVSLLLCLIMALSLIPTVAFATEVGTGGTPTTDANKTTNGKYVNNVWTEDANNGCTEYNNGKLRLYKTAEATNTDNEYTITLKVETSQTTTTTTTPANAATVLVIDTSGSMAWCTKNHRHTDSCYSTEKCTKDTNPGHWRTDFWGDYHIWDTPCRYDWRTQEYYLVKNTCGENQHNHNNATGGSWCNGTGDSRIVSAKAAATKFLYDFKAEGTQRWVAIVSFDDNASDATWYDVSTENGYNNAVAAINKLTASGGTNLDAGLAKARNLMSDDAVKNIPQNNKNVVALTDGAPTKSQTYGFGNYGSEKINTETKNTAAALKNDITGLYTICFAASGEVCYKGGPSVDTFLSNDIASVGKAFIVNDGNDLPTTFAGISSTITSGLTGEGGWTVTDPMAANISVVGTLNGCNDANKIYTWTLSNPTVSGNGNTKTYTYTTSYTVKIDPNGKEADGTTPLSENKFYPTNGVTTLNYKNANNETATANFPVPGVKVKLPAPTEPETGTLTINKTITGLEKNLPSKITFTVKDSDDNVVATPEITLFTAATGKTNEFTGSVTVPNLNIGQTYTVTENADSAKVDGYTLTAPAAQKITFTKENNTVSFTNAYTENTPGATTAKITINKKVDVTGNTQPTTMPAFQFVAKVGDKVVGNLYLTPKKGTDGKWTAQADMNISIPANLFGNNDYVKVTVSEVKDNLTNWTYDTNENSFYINKAGKRITLITAAATAAEVVPATDSIATFTFTNKYTYTYTPPTRPTNPTRRQPTTTTTKPVQSVKTGDMGIALYAVTSLLSLSGTALVIKKRKDEK